MRKKTTNYGKLLGEISDQQLQAALDTFKLGELKSASAIPFGLFGQNILLKNNMGKEYILRTHAHYNWQLPTEHFFSQLIHEKTTVPTPWPYLFTESEEVFEFMFGFAILPRLPGESTADPQIYDKLSPDQKCQLAKALAISLHELQKLTWVCSGKYSPDQGKVLEFENGYINRTISRINEKLKASDTYNSIASTDKKWIRQLVQQFEVLEETSFQPVVVHEDFNKNNVVVEFKNSACHITGLFDLMTAHFGDGLADLPRQFCMFIEDDPMLAKLYLQSYFTDATVDASTRDRLLLYLIDERLLVWEYFHRPDHIDEWEHEPNFRTWLEAYINVMLEATKF